MANTLQPYVPDFVVRRTPEKRAQYAVGMPISMKPTREETNNIRYRNQGELFWLNGGDLVKNFDYRNNLEDAERQIMALRGGAGMTPWTEFAPQDVQPTYHMMQTDKYNPFYFTGVVGEVEGEVDNNVAEWIYDQIKGDADFLDQRYDIMNKYKQWTQKNSVNGFGKKMTKEVFDELDLSKNGLEWDGGVKNKGMFGDNLPMNSIIAALYGNPANGTPVTNTARDPYYSSFEYFNNLNNGGTTPPPSAGGPNYGAVSTYEPLPTVPEGYTPAAQNSPIIQSLYGGMGPVSATNNSRNPDYEAGMFGNTLGGIGNTDADGFDINWSTPFVATSVEGQMIDTPAGTYQVIKTPYGDLALRPMEGASRAAGDYFNNLTHGQHHIGINPETGEIWYQEAAGYNNFSKDGPSTYYENPNGPGFTPNTPNAPSSGGSTGGSTGGSGMLSPQGSSWLHVLGRGGKSLESWDPFLGMFTGQDNSIDWASMGINEINTTFDGLFQAGMFGPDIENAELVYMRLLENLGLA